MKAFTDCQLHQSLVAPLSWRRCAWWPEMRPPCVLDLSAFVLFLMMSHTGSNLPPSLLRLGFRALMEIGTIIYTESSTYSFFQHMTADFDNQSGSILHMKEISLIILAHRLQNNTEKSGNSIIIKFLEQLFFNFFIYTYISHTPALWYHTKSLRKRSIRMYTTEHITYENRPPGTYTLLYNAHTVLLLLLSKLLNKGKGQKLGGVRGGGWGGGGGSVFVFTTFLFSQQLTLRYSSKDYLITWTICFEILLVCWTYCICILQRPSVSSAWLENYTNLLEWHFSYNFICKI